MYDTSKKDGISIEIILEKGEMTQMVDKTGVISNNLNKYNGRLECRRISMR